MGVALSQALLIAAKDTKIFFKDRFAVVFAFLFPFLFVIGFTLALGNIGPEDETLELVLATQETEDSLSADVIDSLTTPERAASGDDPPAESESGGISAMGYADSLAAVESGDIAGFVAFPSDFTDRLARGERTALEVVVSAERDAERQALLGTAQSIAATLSEMTVAISAMADVTQGNEDVDWEAITTQYAQPIEFAIENVGEIEPVNVANFTLPGYLTMFVFFAAAMSAEAIARERQGHTLERLFSNGARRSAIVLGKFVGAAFRGMLQLIALWVVGVAAFGVQLGVSPVAVVVISLLMALASAAFGVMLASLVSDIRAATTAGVLASLVLAPIGGCWWPLFITPEWMQALAKLTPHGWANGGFNKLMLFGADFGDATQEMAAIALFGVAFLAVALWRFRIEAS